jgi:hypothetical protein
VTLSTSRLWFVPGLAAILLLALVPPAPLHAQGLGKWVPNGGPGPDYELGGNPEAKHGSPDGGYIRSITPAPGATGYLRTQVPPGPYLGKRVRLSGYVRTEGVENWAGFWMRVDGPGYELLSFDNMEDRPVKGTADWRKYDVVLDVPARAVNVMFGLILAGRGKAWFDGVTLEPVGADVPTTSLLNPYFEYYEGRYGEASKMFPDMIARMPASYSLRLFHFLALHRSGQVQEARAYINGVAASLTDQKWAAPVVRFYAGRLSEDEVLKAAASADPNIDKEQRCEAYYYLAMAYLLKLGGVQGDAPSNASKAQEYLEKCVATGVTTFVEYRAAQAELGRLKR